MTDEAPKPRRRWRRLLRTAALTYLGVLLVLLWLENRFLFFPTSAESDWHDPPPGLTTRDVELTLPDGRTAHAWWLTPPGWTPQKGALLYCHGNAGNLSQRGGRVRDWTDATGMAVLIFDYPGFGKSEGRPDEAGLYLAGQAALDWLVGEGGVPLTSVVLYGKSLGGAVAIELAARHRVPALVLVNSFTSFGDMAQKTFPFLPARWLVRNQLNNRKRIADIQCPVLVAHGDADRLIPYAHGERLYEAAPEPKRFHAMEGLDHNHSPNAGFFRAVAEFLAEAR